MRAVLIDGTNLFVMHYAANPSLDLNGVPIGGALGTLKAVRKIVNLLLPDRVYFVWDGPGGSLMKRRLFKEYKDGRKPIAGRYYQFENAESAKANKLYQMDILKSLLDSLPVCQIITNDYEADDCIAYIVNNCEYFGHKSNIIVTCDKDYFQLIDERTVVFNPQSKKLIATEELLEEYGIHPKNWLFFKSINGDSSDNLKGVKGFGPKTIQKLFPVGNPEPITPEMIEGFEFEDEKKKVKQKNLTENLETIKRNWELMSLEEPLISIEEKDRLTDKINNFKPSLSKKNFYIDLMRVDGGNITPKFVYDFVRLIQS